MIWAQVLILCWYFASLAIAAFKAAGVITLKKRESSSGVTFTAWLVVASIHLFVLWCAGAFDMLGGAR